MKSALVACFFVFFCGECERVQSVETRMAFCAIPGARFSKFPIINKPGKPSPFILKIEVSKVLHLA